MARCAHAAALEGRTHSTTKAFGRPVPSDVNDALLVSVCIRTHPEWLAPTSPPRSYEPSGPNYSLCAGACPTGYEALNATTCQPTGGQCDIKYPLRTLSNGTQVRGILCAAARQSPGEHIGHMHARACVQARAMLPPATAAPLHVAPTRPAPGVPGTLRRQPPEPRHPAVHHALQRHVDRGA